MKIIHFFFLLTFLLGLAACSPSADKSLLNYEQSLSRADSLAQADTTDNALAAHLLSDLHQEYDRVKELSGGERVRLMPQSIWSRIYHGTLALFLGGFAVWLVFAKVDLVKENNHRRFVVDLSKNEQRLRSNEEEMVELATYLNDMELTDEVREEIKSSLTTLMANNDLLHKENGSLRTQLKGYEKRPLPQELELLKKRDDHIHLLDGQIQALASVMIERDEVVERLHRSPKYLSDADWEHLWLLADRVYAGFTQRLSERFPLLTPSDMQLCLLMRLRFNNAQVATLIAVSPASVSQQKFRLKKRLMQSDETLFKDGETVDRFIGRC